MSVKKFPMRADHARKIIRNTAKDSSRVGIPVDLGYDRPKQDWEHVVTHRQIYRCLEDGDVLGEPELDEHGNWQCRLQRFGSGALVEITVVAVQDKNDDWRLYVTEWSKTDGP